MPKTTEQVYQELKTMGTAGNYAGIAERFRETGKEKYLHLADETEYTSPEIEGIEEYFHDLLREPMSEDSKKIMTGINEEIAKDIVTQMYISGKAWEKYKPKVFNGELPGTEFVAGNQKDSEKLSALIAYTSEEALGMRGLAIGMNTFFTGIFRNYDDVNPFGSKDWKDKRTTVASSEWGVQHPEVDKETINKWFRNLGDTSPHLDGYTLRTYPDDSKPLIEQYPKEIQKYMDASEGELGEYERVIKRDKAKLEDGDRSLHYIDVVKQLRQKELNDRKENLSPKKAYDANKASIDYLLNDDSRREDKNKSDSYKDMISSLKTLRDMQTNPGTHSLKDIREAMENAAKAADVYDKEHSGWRHPFSAVSNDGRARRDSARSISESLKQHLEKFDAAYKEFSEKGIAVGDTLNSLDSKFANRSVEREAHRRKSGVADIVDRKMQEISGAYEQQEAKQDKKKESFEDRKKDFADYASRVLAVNILTKTVKQSLANVQDMSGDDMKKIMGSQKDVTKDEFVQFMANDMLSDKNIEATGKQIQERPDFKRLMQGVVNDERIAVMKDKAGRANGMELVEELRSNTGTMIKNDTMKVKRELENQKRNEAAHSAAPK